jgi:hypothetical protein
MGYPSRTLVEALERRSELVFITGRSIIGKTPTKTGDQKRETDLTGRSGEGAANQNQTVDMGEI